MISKVRISGVLILLDYRKKLADVESREKEFKDQSIKETSEVAKQKELVEKERKDLETQRQTLKAKDDKH